MLQSLNNMDKVFRQSRILTIVCVIGMVVVSLTSVSYVYSAQRQQSQIVYALIGDNAVSLSAVDVLENRPVEANNHVELFHRRLFGLDPDREVIDRNLNAALSMADNSVQTLVDAYEEDGDHRGDQQHMLDSRSLRIHLRGYGHPAYDFRDTGELTITRPSVSPRGH